MQLAGSKSWRSTFDVPAAPHIALFIRDALRLDRAEDAPPPLEGEIPDRASLIVDRQHAASSWHSWWHTLLTPVDGHPPASGGDVLGGSVRELEQEARAWFYEHREPHIPPQRDAMRDWEITRDAVEAAAVELAVAPHSLHADTWLLLVAGEWWQRPAPGQLIYSPAVREDPELVLTVLRSTFASSLNTKSDRASTNDQPPPASNGCRVSPGLRSPQAAVGTHWQKRRQNEGGRIVHGRIRMY